MFCFIFIIVTRLEVLNFATWLVLRNHNIQQDTRDNRRSQYVYFVLKPFDQADYLDTKQRHYCRYRVLLGSQ